MLLEDIGNNGGVDDDQGSLFIPGGRPAPAFQGLLEAIVDLVLGPTSGNVFVTLNWANPLLPGKLFKRGVWPELEGTQLDLVTSGTVFRFWDGHEVPLFFTSFIPGPRLAKAYQGLFKTIVDLVLGPTSSNVFVTHNRSNPLLSGKLFQGGMLPKLIAS